VALVVLPLLLLGAWLQYRDPSLGTHALRAALGTSFRMSRDGPSSSSEIPPTVLAADQPPALLQYIHAARAVPETERPDAAPQAAASLAGARARARAESYETWLHVQALKRLNDEENKYGL